MASAHHRPVPPVLEITRVKVLEEALIVARETLQQVPRIRRLSSTAVPPRLASLIRLRPCLSVVTLPREPASLIEQRPCLSFRMHENSSLAPSSWVTGRQECLLCRGLIGMVRCANEGVHVEETREVQDLPKLLCPTLSLLVPAPATPLACTQLLSLTFPLELVPLLARLLAELQILLLQDHLLWRALVVTAQLLDKRFTLSLGENVPAIQDALTVEKRVAALQCFNDRPPRFFLGGYLLLLFALLMARLKSTSHNWPAPVLEQESCQLCQCL